MTPLDLAKERLGIVRLAELRAWDWKPGKTCRLPYQPDRNESGSVFEGGRLFHDFTSGETMDAPALLARVEGLSNVEACKLFIELAGVKPGDVPRDLRPSAPAPINARLSAEPPRVKPELPYLTKPGREDLARIAALRGLSIEGVALAAHRGFLSVATLNGRRCWALADASRWLCQLRPLDGKPFVKQDGGTFKARTCRGSWGAWPLGCVEAARFDSVALVEGGGDFLAAWHFIAADGAGANCAPVGMLGAGHRILAAALPHFAGKGETRAGHGLIMAGPSDCGKSFIQEHVITWLFGGRSADPTKFLLGKTTFNAEMGGAEHLMMQELPSGLDFKSRDLLKTELKRLITTESHSHHPKYCDALTLYPWWRVSLSINSNVDSLKALPGLTSDFGDKILLLLCESHPMPMPTGTRGERPANPVFIGLRGNRVW